MHFLNWIQILFFWAFVIFIGNEIGPSGDNKLAIEGAGDESTPLIYVYSNTYNVYILLYYLLYILG